MLGGKISLPIEYDVSDGCLSSCNPPSQRLSKCVALWTAASISPENLPEMLIVGTSPRLSDSETVGSRI